MTQFEEAGDFVGENVMAELRSERDEARRLAEQERDEHHKAFCAGLGYDPEHTSKVLLPWEAR